MIDIQSTFDGKTPAFEAIQDEFQKLGDQVKNPSKSGMLIANNAATAIREHYLESGLYSRSNASRAGTYAFIYSQVEGESFTCGVGNPMPYAEIQDKGGPAKDTIIQPKQLMSKTNPKYRATLRIPSAYPTFGGPTGKASQFIFRRKVVLKRGAIRASHFMSKPFIESAHDTMDKLFEKIGEK